MKKQIEMNRSKGTHQVTQRIIASPAARKIAREKGIDLNRVQTMDPFGRVRSQDLSENEVDTRNAFYKSR